MNGCSCEWSEYFSFHYCKDDKDRERPYVNAPYAVDSYFDRCDGSGHFDKYISGVRLCKLTMQHRKCYADNKYCCDKYKKYLENKKKPKPPVMWNYETKQLEYGIPVDYNNWNM